MAVAEFLQGDSKRLLSKAVKVNPSLEQGLQNIGVADHSLVTSVMENFLPAMEPTQLQAAGNPSPNPLPRTDRDRSPMI